MRRLFPLIFALAFVGCDQGPKPAVDTPPARSVLDTVVDDPKDGFPVTRVVDGDTLHLDRNGEDVTVRLLRVNTRERGEWGYKQGQSELKRLVDGKRVRLETDDEEKDRYGRELAYIFVGPKNINLEMVRSGWSPFYTKYGKGDHAEAFAAAEKEARKAKRGLWGRPDEAKKNDEMARPRRR
ncbi:MAG: thermonuclease family protein [Fimbriimonas sp.]